MLLLSIPRNGRQRRASLLLLAAVLLCAVPVSAGLPAGSKCPGRIDCAKEGREFCKPGSSHCGPCLYPLKENEEGRCAGRKKHHQVHHGKVKFYPELDEEIDYLRSVIEKQEVTEIKPPNTQPKHPAAVTAQTDVKKSKTYASQHKQKSQGRLSDETPHATTTRPHPAISVLPNTPTTQPRATKVGGRAGPIAIPVSRNDGIIVIMISLCVVVGTVAVILATVCYINLRKQGGVPARKLSNEPLWTRLQKESRLAQKVDYPAFRGAGVPAANTNGNGTSMGDKTLAQSAQMYHYQHQKQQMLSAGNSHKPEQKVLDTEVTSDEEEVGGDFTVYECPGLAPTGEMEVKNPLFDDSTLHYQGNHK